MGPKTEESRIDSGQDRVLLSRNSDEDASVAKGKNTHTAERPAACDSIRGNKAVDLFPLIKSQAAGRSTPSRCVCVFVP
jgi:hypothetical protein